MGSRHPRPPTNPPLAQAEPSFSVSAFCLWLTIPTSSSVFSWTSFLLFFFLSDSFFSFSGRILSIQARSCWEKIKSRSLRTMIRPRIWGGKKGRKAEALWALRDNCELGLFSPVG